MDHLERPYNPINEYYKKRFGEKVYKISVSVPGTCPNREGIRGMKPCNFCDEWGSAAFPEFREKELSKQIESIKEVVRIRHRVHKFLLYFQAYTNTFRKTQVLKDHIEVGLKSEDICGIVVGTRPDCLSENVVELLNHYAERTAVFVELGVQSFDNGQLEWMRRGHSAEKSIWAIEKIRAQCPKVNLGIHLIFGLPQETDSDLIKTAHTVNKLNIDNVKLHNLHVLTKTPLEQEYLRGDFKPLEREEYVRRVGLFLRHLDPKIYVHRLTAVASRHDELVAPRWTTEKMRSYQFAIDYLKERQWEQGQEFSKQS
ncbi:MAG: TIGR01212 family radical SAM protein [Bdellovibrionales bacterium]|nr:TIGR01212 family radical SAM protein [Bdellovibrionales bacterium]